MKTQIKSLIIGPPGSGKTYHAGTYPKSYWISTEPGGYDTILSNPELLKNTVKQEYFIPSLLVPIETVFKNVEAACLEAHKLYKEGKIETLILDNMTYFSQNRWMYKNKFERIINSKGVEDTRAMYGRLKDWLWEFTLLNLTGFPGNVVVTCHVKQESDEIMEKKIGKNNVVPDILGSFRDLIPGMFSTVLFIDKVREGENKYKYIVRTDIGSGKLAKNRFNLDEVLTNVSYTTVTDAIKKAQGK